MRLLGLLAAVLMAPGLLAQSGEGTDDQWVCVPGENGQWRCGEPGEDLESGELPPAQEPAPGPSLFELPEAGEGLPPPSPLQRSETPSDPLLAPAEPARMNRPDADFSALGFALQLAKVSDLESARRFVADFEIDPSEVRQAASPDDDRYLVLYGDYTSLAQARTAVAGLPTMIRALQPQAIALASLPGSALPLGNASARAAAPASPTTTAPEPVVAVSEPERPERSLARVGPQEAATILPDSTDPADDGVPQSRTDRAEEDAGSTIAPVAEPDPEPVREPTRPIDDRPAPTAQPDEAAATETDIAALAGPDQEAARIESAPVQARPEPPAAMAEPAIIDRDESESLAARPEPVVEAEPETPPAPTRPRPPERSPPSSATARPEPARPSPDSAGRQTFADADADSFTLQLTSQRSLEATERYLARLPLDRNRIHRVLIDEGAGPRWLVLYGVYPNLAAANSTLTHLPGGIRSPWSRRIGPIQEGMIESR